MKTVLFVLMDNQNVQIETHVVNFRQDNGVVVLLDTLVMFLREAAGKGA